jgi:glycosyltransferase involved in cell wall biosynthesis
MVFCSGSTPCRTTTTTMSRFVSVVIPNHDGEATIGRCLEAAYASLYDSFEVIVVDDCSTDGSVGVIEKFPCTLLRLRKHAGASVARNKGAEQAKGDILFFTDADCLLEPDAIAIASQTLSREGPETIVGGTYTRIPYDDSFFSCFQSVFVNYSETKRPDNPDYVATHAMVIDACTFRKSSGFCENFLPILEDVEYSHRLRKTGYRLLMNPHIQVQHIFNYSLFGSLENAVTKSMYWSVYSLKNRDFFGDSGAASIGLKINVVAYLVVGILFLLSSLGGKAALLWAVPGVFILDLLPNTKLLNAFYRTKNLPFAVAAALYYFFVYPAAVAVGMLIGLLRYPMFSPTLRGSR